MMNSKKVLSQALIKLCETKPLDDVTVTEITQMANMTRQIFYYHFVDKYELAKWIHLVDYYEYVMEQKEPKKVLKWTEFSYEWILVIKNHRKFYRNVYRSSKAKEFQHIMENHIYNFYVYAFHYILNGELSGELEFIIKLYTIGSRTMINEWIYKGMQISVEELCSLLFRAMPTELQVVLQQEFPRSVLMEFVEHAILHSEV